MAGLDDAGIAVLVRAFEDGSLPRPEWTHAAHLITALWFSVRHPRGEAATLTRDGIRRYNERHGNPTGYHETITLARVAVIGRFLSARGRTRPISTLAKELLPECGDGDYLLRFYSGERLFSEVARGRWVPPDLDELE